GFGDVLCKGPEPDTLPTSHDDGPVLSWPDPQQLTEEMNAQEAALGVQNRHLIDAARPHQVKHVGAARFRPHPRKPPLHHAPQASIIQCRPAEQGPPHVTVCKSADHSLPEVANKSDALPSRIDH